MGIANPVTRETHGSGTNYHMQLAKQLEDMLQAPLEVGFSPVCVLQKYKTNSGTLFSTFNSLPMLLSQERGGMMSLTEVYCLVNRARGMEVMLTC